ncbi:MAG: hypothetical protein JO026_03985, partial [Patescibacteria group bacterium]|nr:hypothetical protein [Patescibacteria group bacterium]
MSRLGAQKKLFDTPESLANGLVYRPDFITEREEERILNMIGTLPMEHARFGEYTSKRRIAAFGWGYDEENERFIRGEALPEFLESLAKKIAKWLDIPRFRVVEALINEYEPGTQLGWH